VNLLIGQCHGFIRLPNARAIYFHRADLQEGTAFNDLQIGDAVTFDEGSSWGIVSAPLNVAVRWRVEHRLYSGFLLF
jgi:hypothetical protein